MVVLHFSGNDLDPSSYLDLSPSEIQLELKERFLCVLYGGPVLSFLGFPNNQKRKDALFQISWGSKNIKHKSQMASNSKGEFLKKCDLIANIQYKVIISLNAE